MLIQVIMKFFFPCARPLFEAQFSDAVVFAFSCLSVDIILEQIFLFFPGRLLVLFFTLVVYEELVYGPSLEQPNSFSVEPFEFTAFFFRFSISSIFVPWSSSFQFSDSSLVCRIFLSVCLRSTSRTCICTSWSSSLSMRIHSSNFRIFCLWCRSPSFHFGGFRDFRRAFHCPRFHEAVIQEFWRPCWSPIFRSGVPRVAVGQRRQLARPPVTRRRRGRRAEQPMLVVQVCTSARPAMALFGVSLLTCVPFIIQLKLHWISPPYVSCLSVPVFNMFLMCLYEFNALIISHLVCGHQK